MLGFRFFQKRTIGSVFEPYMTRYVLLGFPWGGGIYLHQFHRSDHDRALHDHPWPFVAVVLKGGYWERHYRSGAPEVPLHEYISWRGPGAVLYRPATWQHRVELNYDPRTGGPVPSWSLAFVGPRQRRWGFWVPRNDGPPVWCHWRRYNTDKAICEDHDLYTGGED